MSSDPIPVVETYRGVGIHDQQPKERIDMVVRPAIDRVLDEIDDAGELLRYAGNSDNPPEARLLAGAKLLALFELSAEARWTRPPGVTRETVLATIAGLNSVRWRDPWHYCSLLDVRRPPGGGKPPRREVPLA